MVTKEGLIVLVSMVNETFSPALHLRASLGVKTVLLMFIGKLERSGSY